MKALIVFCPLIFASCSSYEKTDQKIQKQVLTTAISDVHSTEYQNLSGTVLFENVPEGIKVKADLAGLPKNKTLGFHIHQVGACEGPDYKTAGDHFNPTQSVHGGPGYRKRHFGDLGNLVTDAAGSVKYEIIIPKNADSDFDLLINKSILIHASKDDFKTQPSGNSGARIACGIIMPIGTEKKVSMFNNAFAEQGTLSTDDSETSASEASLSGTRDKEIDLREEEVQLQEEDNSRIDQPHDVNGPESDDFEEELEN